MPTTAEFAAATIANEVTCFGCTKAELVATIEDQINNFFGRPVMIAASLCSDAQELIARGQGELARQTLNRAKFVLFTYADAMRPKET